MPSTCEPGLRAVPLYDSLGESAVEYTVTHSDTSIIFAEASKVEFIAKAAGAIKKSVKHVVFWGSHASTDAASATIKKEACSDCILPAFNGSDYALHGTYRPTQGFTSLLKNLLKNLMI